MKYTVIEENSYDETNYYEIADATDAELEEPQYDDSEYRCGNLDVNEVLMLDSLAYYPSDNYANGIKMELIVDNCKKSGSVFNDTFSDETTGMSNMVNMASENNNLNDLYVFNYSHEVQVVIIWQAEQEMIHISTRRVMELIQ